jgi:ligand-binding sensor domain-containing protein
MTNTKTIVSKIIVKKTLLYSLLSTVTLLISCNTQNKPEDTKITPTEQSTLAETTANSNLFEANKVTELGKNILCIYQDRKGHYWFGTQNQGVYRYDGKNLILFTEKDGLSNNQIQTIQEDKLGNIWFGTGGFGVSRFDGQTFTVFTTKEVLQSTGNSTNEWKIEPNDLWFNAGGGAYRYNGISLTYLPFPKTSLDSKYSQSAANRLGPYSVYCNLKDKKGNLWFGTQSMGACRYDGNTFTWFTEKGLAGPAVLGLFEDKNGNLWFGNNGSGLFRYDGKSLTNFTKEKGLSNDEFKVSGKDNPGTLARLYSINEDNSGNLLVGTIDAGVWQYNGKKLTNYTIKDGLTSNAITTIYKDRKGELWFGTEADICKFNGTSFTVFDVKQNNEK